MPHPVGHIQIPRFEMDFKSAADNVPGGRRGAISGELSALSANVFHQVDRGEIRMQQRNQRLSHILRTEDVSEPVQRQELRQFLDIRAGLLRNYEGAVQRRQERTPLAEEAAEVVLAAVGEEQRPDLIRLDPLRRKPRKLLCGVNTLRHSSANAPSAASASFAVASMSLSFATHAGECRYLVGTDRAQVRTPPRLTCIAPLSLPPAMSVLV